MATPRVCSFPDCGKPHSSHGYCHNHARRLRLYGDPLGGKTSPGTAIKWVEANLGYNGDGCLTWPFGRTPEGYGMIMVDGCHQGAHVYVCSLVRGPRPSDEHHAAHGCGRGKFGCVDPRHLRWATPSENDSDKDFHGTRQAGEKHPLAKLTDEDVRFIRKMRGKMRLVDLAARFGICTSSVSNIQLRRSWRHIPD